MSKETIVSKRRNKIVTYLEENESATSEELAIFFSTSPITIRRDLGYLESKGLITRYHGGAKLTQTDEMNNSIKYKELQKKISIAKYAASLIEDGDTIFINSSSTALLILDFLEDKRVAVITNNGKALNSKIGPNIELILTGGEVYGRKQSMVGEFSTYILSKITASKCFMGFSGIDLSFGMSTSVLNETFVNKEMISRCSGKLYALVDSSKVGLKHSFSSGNIKDIDYLITDSDLNKDIEKEFYHRGVNIITVDYKKN